MLSDSEAFDEDLAEDFLLFELFFVSEPEELTFSLLSDFDLLFCLPLLSEEVL